MSPSAFKRLGCASALVWVLALQAVGGTADSAPRRVLVVESFGRDVAPFSAVVMAFRSTLANELGEPLDLQEASLEANRVGSPAMEGPFVEFLRSRLKGRPLELVVPLGAPAAAFVARHRFDLLQGAPVVFAASDPRLVRPEWLTTNALHVTHRLDLPEHVRHVLHLKPDTTNLVVILGASPLERFWEAECRREFEPLAGHVQFTWLTDQPFPEIRKRVGALPARSFVLFLMFTVDTAGVPYERDQALRELAGLTSAPIYGLFASQFGLGTVGGLLYPDSALGVEAARVGIRILRGESPSAIPSRYIGAETPTYDWREIVRWGIDKTRLPAGSVLRFRQPTVLEMYRWHIAGGALVVLTETALIALLVSSLIRRRRAEMALRENEQRLSLATTAAEIGVFAWDIARNDVWASENWRRMFGFPLAQPLRYETVLERIDPADRPSVHAAVQRAVAGSADYVGEYRLRTPDGGQRWIAVRGRRLPPDPGQPGRMLGVAVDITARKAAEAAAHELSGRLITAQEAERTRLARELHDDISQRLARLAIDVAQCERSMEESLAVERAREVREGLVRLSEDVHALSYRLHPAVLEDLGLVEALRTECDRCSRRESIPVEVEADAIPDGCPPEVALALFRVAQEALRNVVRHARAHSVRVSLRSVGEGLQLAVHDDGCGFDLAAARGCPRLGLASMRERVEILGGELDIETAPGHSTTVLAWVPIRRPDA